MKAFITAGVVALIVLATTATAGDSVVARVGNEAVTSREITEALAREPGLTRERALELLIERRLVQVWADGRNIVVEDGEIDRALTSIRQSNNLTEEQFEKALESRGETAEIFRSNLREQLTINKALRFALDSKLQITEEELQEAYGEAFPPKTNFQVSHILLTVDKDASSEEEAQVLDKARWILDEIKGGTSFDGMALKHSQDTSSADNGGYLGTFSEGELLPELEKLATDLEAGEVGGPVKTSAGYHILFLESRELSKPPAMSEVRATLERNLLAQKEESARDEWLKELKETTYIEVFPDDE